MWEFGLVVMAAGYLAPGTLVSLPLEFVVRQGLDRLGLLGVHGHLNVYGQNAATMVGCVLVPGLVTIFVQALGDHTRFSRPARQFSGAFCVFCAVFLLNCVISRGGSPPDTAPWWPFFALASFYVVALVVSIESTKRLCRLLIVLVAVEAAYAVAYYAMGVQQFRTPRFGNRTGGTFADPNTLYPLCMVMVPLGFVLSGAARPPICRLTLAASSAVTLLALVLTYTRSAWLALAVALFWLSVSPVSGCRDGRAKRTALLALSAALVLGSVLVRTRGSLIGNPQDRSFWGRTAIWQVALHAFRHHPWLGSGVGSYAREQRAHILPQLVRFGPMNIEAKSLYLNLAVETGLLGLGAFALLCARYLALYRDAMRRLPNDSEDRAVLVGIHAGFVSLVVAGLVDTPLLHGSRLPSTFLAALLMGVVLVIANGTRSHPRLVGDIPGEGARVETIRGTIRRAFSLVEILVVIGVLGLLAALLYPVFARVRETAHQTTCRSNLRQLTTAWLLYAQDFDGRAPAGAYTRWADPVTLRPMEGRHYAPLWVLQPYTRSERIFICPSKVGWDTRSSDPALDDFRPSQGSYASNYQAMDVHESQLGRPTELIAFCDSYLPWQDCYARCSSCPGGCSSLIWGRIGRGCFEGDCRKRTDWHNEGLLLSFADGHVKWSSLARIHYRNWVRELSERDPHFDRPITEDW